MSHRSERLGTELASGTLRAEQTSWILKALLSLLLELEWLEATQVLTSAREKSLQIERAGRVLEDGSKRSFLENSTFFRLGIFSLI